MSKVTLYKGKHRSLRKALCHCVEQIAVVSASSFSGVIKNKIDYMEAKDDCFAKIVHYLAALNEAIWPVGAPYCLGAGKCHVSDVILLQVIRLMVLNNALPWQRSGSGADDMEFDGGVVVRAYRKSRFDCHRYVDIALP